MKKSDLRDELASRIRALIHEFEERSHGEIKQNNLAKLLGVSASTLSRAKSSIYKIQINTLQTLSGDLKKLLEEYQRNPEAFLAKVENHNHISSFDSFNDKSTGSSSIPKLKWISLIVISIPIIIFSLNKDITLLQVGSTSNLVDTFTTNFQNIVPEELLHGNYKDWTIHNIDTNFLLNQQSSQALTMHTLPGGYWQIPEEQNVIKTLFVRKIHCISCLVGIKLYGFYPTRFRQHAGLYLFKEKNGTFDVENYVSLEAGSGDSHGDDGTLGINVTATHNGEIRYHVEQSPLNFLHPKDSTFVPLDTIYLYLHINHESKLITSYYRRQSEWTRRERIIEPGMMLQGREPTYLGFGASQLYNHDRGAKVEKDTIPVFIEWVKVMELH